MLYVSLDESGQIEESSRKDGKNKPVLIGGLVYDDHNQSGDYNNEKSRIDMYLKAVCAHEKAMMPDDLHFVDRGTSEEVDRVRDQIHSTLGKFLQKGICEFDDGRDNEYSEELKNKTKMPPRKGEYHLFIYLKYGAGMENLMGRGLSNLVKDDVASNLYEHMISEILGRVLFHNPVLENVKEVKLDLPTRVRKVKISSELNARKEYDNLGYEGEIKEAGQVGLEKVYTVADADIYRTILEREIMRSRHLDVQIEELNVRSILYKSKLERDINTESYAFLYLADLICDIQADCSSQQSMIESFKTQADELTGHKNKSAEWNMVFAYDEIDLIYQEAFEKLEQKDYYEVLSLIYEGEHLNSPYVKFYTNVWFPYLRQRLQSESDTNAYSIALRKLYLSSRRNNLDQEELLEIYRGLEAIKENMGFDSVEEKESVLYELYDAGTSAFDHIGDSKKAEECYNKCEEYAGNVEIERYLRTRNKKVVFLTDSFRFDEAMKVAEKDEEVHQFLIEARELIPKEGEKEKDEKKGNEFHKDYGIALSQAGQILSFMHDSSAESKFLKALDEIGEKGTSDYNQTLSYLLHYYLSVGEKEKYEKCAVDYFDGNTTLKEQFRYIAREGGRGRQSVISMKFAMYVFIKGIYLFHAMDQSKDLKDILDNLETRIREFGGEEAADQIKGHPWEIIYKYLALIALKRNQKNRMDKCLQNIRRMIKNPTPTIDAICTFGELEFARESGDEKSERDSLGKLKAIFQENCYKVYDSINWNDPDEAYGYLKENVLNYMYS